MVVVLIVSTATQALDPAMKLSEVPTKQHVSIFVFPIARRSFFESGEAKLFVAAFSSGCSLASTFVMLFLHLKSLLSNLFPWAWCVLALVLSMMIQRVWLPIWASMTCGLLVENVDWSDEDTIVATYVLVRETEELDVRSAPGASPPLAVRRRLSRPSRLRRGRILIEMRKILL
jgi:hypothetical protein